MFVFKKYDRQNHVWSFMTKYLRFLCKFTSCLSIFYEYQQFFQHLICFSIQPPDYSDLWHRLARSTSFFLIMLFNNYKKWYACWEFEHWKNGTVENDGDMQGLLFNKITRVRFMVFVSNLMSLLTPVTSMKISFYQMIRRVHSMLKYVINRFMHAFFHIRTVIIAWPISTLGLKPSGRYRHLIAPLDIIYKHFSSSYFML
jgi:hypothetical protein